ncbi:hypothetical protein ACWGCC_03895 [Streptomyces nigrescens]
MANTATVTSLDAQIEEAFGRPIGVLRGEVEAPAVRRVLEMRAMLAVVEQHLDQVRARLHSATDPERPTADLAADDLTVDAEWLAAAASARNRHVQDITTLLRTMPPATAPAARPVQAKAQAVATAIPPPAMATTATSPHR